MSTNWLLALFLLQTAATSILILVVEATSGAWPDDVRERPQGPRRSPSATFLQEPRTGCDTAGVTGYPARSPVTPVPLERDSQNGNAWGTTGTRGARSVPTRLAPSSSTTTRRGES